MPSASVLFSRVERPSIRGAQILVVDDELLAATVLARILTFEGHFVRTVASATEALERFWLAPPDLLITDLMMPGMDGVELARAVRALPVGADVPIVMVSGLADRESRVRSIEYADEFLLKPVDSFELCLRVQAMLKRTARLQDAEEQIRRLRSKIATLECAQQKLPRELVSDECAASMPSSSARRVTSPRSSWPPRS